MKIALIGLDANLSNISHQERVIDFVKFNIQKLGENPSLVSYFNNSFDALKSIVLSNYNLVVCVGSDSAIYNYNIKDNLAKMLGSKLERNLSCEVSLKKYCNNHSIQYTSQEEMQGNIPANSIPLCDGRFYNNGFIFKHYNSYVVFIPSDIEFVKTVFEPVVMPFINDLITTKLETITLRCYGILEKDLRAVLKDELNIADIQIQISSNRLDNIIFIRYAKEVSSMIQSVIAEICSKLSKFIYSTENTNLYETATNLLKLQRKKIVIAETLTYGNIAMNLSKINENTIEYAYTFNGFESINKKLRLDQKIIDQFGEFSVNSVYELDNILLQESTADIAVFVLGDKYHNQCFIAIGDIDGIHVYKNKILNFDEDLIYSLSETTLFYLIKKLRQNDLQFS